MPKRAAYLIDRRETVEAAGDEFYVVRPVKRHGDLLVLRTERLAVDDGQAFFLPPELPGDVMRRGPQLLVPVRASYFDAVPWQDVPDVPRRNRWTPATRWPHVWAMLRPKRKQGGSASSRAVVARALKSAKRAAAKDPGYYAQDALVSVVDSAGTGWLPDLATEAIDAIERDGEYGWNYYRALDRFFDLAPCSYFIPKRDRLRWEAATRCSYESDESDEGWRSNALAQFGLQRLMRGDVEVGVRLWGEAGDPDPIDKILSSTASTVASGGLMDDAIAVADLIKDDATRAKALAGLIYFVE